MPLPSTGLWFFPSRLVLYQCLLPGKSMPLDVACHFPLPGTGLCTTTTLLPLYPLKDTTTTALPACNLPSYLPHSSPPHQQTYSYIPTHQKHTYCATYNLLFYPMVPPTTIYAPWFPPHQFFPCLYCSVFLVWNLLLFYPIYLYKDSLLYITNSPNLAATTCLLLYACVLLPRCLPRRWFTRWLPGDAHPHPVPRFRAAYLLLASFG